MFVVVIKQKTAYEMLISDWSSDVCSSDLFLQRHAGDAPLVEEHGGRVQNLAPLPLETRKRGPGRPLQCCAVRIGVGHHRSIFNLSAGVEPCPNSHSRSCTLFHEFTEPCVHLPNIGRSSCRDSWCQSV